MAGVALAALAFSDSPGGGVAAARFRVPEWIIAGRMEVRPVALTPKQQRFVEEYLVDLNATQAAIRAGYSEKNAGKIGPELLGKTGVSAAIQAAKRRLSERTEITAERILLELAKIGFADASDSQNSNLRSSSKLRALELLAKYTGIEEAKHREAIRIELGEEMEEYAE